MGKTLSTCTHENSVHDANLEVLICSLTVVAELLLCSSWNVYSSADAVQLKISASGLCMLN